MGVGRGEGGRVPHHQTGVVTGHPAGGESERPFVLVQFALPTIISPNLRKGFANLFFIDSPPVNNYSTNCYKCVLWDLTRDWREAKCVIELVTGQNKTILPQPDITLPTLN